MVKYILVTYCPYPGYNGLVYSLAGEYSNTRIEVEALCNLKEDDVTVGESLVFDDNDKYKDVTPIYDKMEKLILQLTGAVKEYNNVVGIKKRFTKGVYPTKSEFRIMNKLWAKYNEE